MLGNAFETIGHILHHAGPAPLVFRTSWKPLFTLKPKFFFHVFKDLKSMAHNEISDLAPVGTSKKNT